MSCLQFDGHEIREGKSLKVNISVPNVRLFVGNIPKSKSREEILTEFTKLTGNKLLESSDRNDLISLFKQPDCMMSLSIHRLMTERRIAVSVSWSSNHIRLHLWQSVNWRRVEPKFGHVISWLTGLILKRNLIRMLCLRLKYFTSGIWSLM